MLRIKKIWSNTTAKIITISTVVGALGLLVGSLSTVDKKFAKHYSKKAKDDLYHSYTIAEIKEVFETPNKLKVFIDTINHKEVQALLREQAMNEKIGTVIVILQNVNNKLKDNNEYFKIMLNKD